MSKINSTSVDKPKEECGVIGVYNADQTAVSHSLYNGLLALQHRGQESCGMVTNDDAKLYQVRDSGLVSKVFANIDIDSLKGNIGVGHVRYATCNEQRENAQPLVSRYCKGSVTLAHNGNIINALNLKEDLENMGAIFQSTTGVEVIMHLIAVARTQTKSIEDAVLKVMGQIEGAYSMVLMSPRKLLAIRDPQGFRPLCLGKKGDNYVVASESCALAVLGAEFVRDVEPGEVVVIDHEGVRSHKDYCGKKPALCMFEYLYFARPDSILDGVSVYNTRFNLGKRLAERHPVEADMVIGVPYSGLNFAQGYSSQSKIPYGDGLIRNRYASRIPSRQSVEARVNEVSLKLSVLKANIVGKKIVMVDDSIVRGTTIGVLVKMLKDHGAKEVHVRIAAPPFMWPCHFGTDIPIKKELLAVKYSVDEMCKKLNADSLGFIAIEDFKAVGLREDFGYCDGCFSGEYPVNI